jgi:hypothetical protein
VSKTLGMGFKAGIDVLAKKGSKALHVLMKTINSNNIRPKTALHLFNKLCQSYINPFGGGLFF